MDYIDETLWDATYDSALSGFQPNEEYIVAALPVVCTMYEKLLGAGLLLDNDVTSVRLAIGCIVGHLELAYPKIKELLKKQSVESNPEEGA
jgi:hypothetical protein